MYKNNNTIMFGSSSSTQNQMLAISAESDIVRARDEVDYQSPLENVPSAVTVDQQSGQTNRSHSCRHTRTQLQELEAFFLHCPHPDQKQRKDLSRDLGLEPQQIKFWFQNKRTKLRAQKGSDENEMLRAENAKLLAENAMYIEALSNTVKCKCENLSTMSFEDQHLSISGVQTTGMVAQPETLENSMIVELAVISMEELVILAKARSVDLLWVPTNYHTEALNEVVYNMMFPSKPLGLGTEASRDSAIVNMQPTNIIEILLNVENWSTFFFGIVSKAFTLETLLTGVAGNYNGAMQVMLADFQLPSPLVAARENFFVRYCKQLPDGIWAIVDAPLENLQPNASISRSQRRPSGCLIQEMPNSFSKVTWVEIVELDDRAPPNIYGPLINSGLAFGAKRWLSVLQRQCQRLASSIAGSVRVGNLAVAICEEGRRSMLKLSERMLVGFNSCVGSNATHANWAILAPTIDEGIRVMTRTNTHDLREPLGIVLSATTSFWLPCTPKFVFDFLRSENSRNEWDILSNGEQVQEVAHIANGPDPGNYVSLLHFNGAPNTSQSNKLLLQESCTDVTGSYIVYAPVDTSTMNIVLSGGDSSYIALLPSGFAILPDGLGLNGIGSGGTLLTAEFQILDSTPMGVENVNNLIKLTVERIKFIVSQRTGNTI